MSYACFHSWIIGFSKINDANLKKEGNATLFPLQFIYEIWRIHVQEKIEYIVEDFTIFILREQDFKHSE